MKKEKTLSEKRISWHEEAIFYNRDVFKEVPLINGDRVFREVDVRQFIKDVLDKIEDIKFDWESGIPFCSNEREKEAFYHIVEDLANLILTIKQKAGEELLK